MNAYQQNKVTYEEQVCRNTHTKRHDRLSCSFVSAPDSSEAEDIFIAREGEVNVDVTLIVEKGDEQYAFDTYHKESTVED
jgi:hypothetical protein